MRLISIAEDNWERIDGEMAGRGVDLMEIPFDRFLNAIYAFVVRSFQDEKDRTKFEVRLNLPMPGKKKSALQETSSPWAPAQETAALGSLAAAVGGGAR